MRSLEDAAVNGQKVLIRLGLDVPLVQNGSEWLVADDTRLRSILPTLHWLLNRHAKVIIVSHLGRPGGKIKADLSLRPVYTHLAALLKKPIQFAPQLFSAATEAAVAGLPDGQILGLENLRFDPGEDNNARTFAKKLARYGDLYVNEAFSVSHREAASLVAITEFLPSYAGLQLEREYQILTSLLRHPAAPFVAIVGGAKIADKLPFLKQLVQKADLVLVGGGIANTFLAASGVDIKKSLSDTASLPAATAIMKQARGKIVLPIDFVWHEDQILDLGPKTTELFQSHLKRAKTVFWNGNLGKSEDPRFAVTSEAIARFLASRPATTIVGGGDTAEIVTRLKLNNKLSFVSSGGGATLELLAGQKLPGLEALNHSQ